MNFEVQGTSSDGRSVRVRGRAATIEAAIEKVRSRGVSVAALRVLPDVEVEAVALLPGTPAAARSAIADESRADGPETGSIDSAVSTEIASPSSPTTADAPRAQDSALRRGTKRASPATVALGCVTILSVAVAFYFAVRRPGGTDQTGGLDSSSTNRRAAVASLVVSGDSVAPPPPVPEPAPENVVRGSDGRWHPAPGYEWVSDGGGDTRVRWVSGRSHPSYRDIRSAEKQDYWTADPGYAFPKKGDLTAQWQPGATHPEFQNIKASERKDVWKADAGFTFPGGETSSARPMAVTWTPGLADPSLPHLVAGPTAGRWRPAAGYAFANETPGDMQVVKIVPPAAKPFVAAAPKGPTDEEIGAAAANLVGALVAQQFVNLEPESITDAIVSGLAIAARDEMLQEGARKLLTGISASQARAIAAVISDAVDGRLRYRSWLSAATRSEVASRIRTLAPSITDSASAATFVCAVAQAYYDAK